MKRKIQKLIQKSRYSTFLSENKEIKDKISNEIEMLYEKYKDYYVGGNKEYLVNVFIAIPLYRLYISEGKDEKEVINELGQIMYDFLSKQKKAYEKLFKSSFLYSLMRKIIPSKFNKLNSLGWEIQKEKQSKGEIYFTVKKCLVHEILKKEDALAIGKIFCNTDLYLYMHLPYTEFKRKETLIKGGSCCDMRFIRHKEKDFDRYPSN